MTAKSKGILAQDPELKAMLEVFGALKDLSADAQLRVLEYVERRLGLQRSTVASRQGSEGSSRTEPEMPVAPAVNPEPGEVEEEGDLEGISPIARKWMRRNDLSPTSISELYSLGVDEIDLVAKKVPGASARERLHSVVLLQGVASYLSSGVPRIDNDKMREASRHYDADVGGNLTTYLRNWASEVSGSRSAGDLTLTTRGLNSAKELIKQMTAPATKDV